MKLTFTNSLKLGVAPLAVSLAMLASPAMADDAATPAPDAASPSSSEAATIIVTGSRIPRKEANSSVPISVVSAASITNVGQTNLLDALRDLPIAGQSAGTSASNFSNSGNGEATVNLRNLGPARTLVLINGRRSVGVPGSSAVDLNNIPTELIDHVEIVTGGASAVYGSDAVAGVVNIILKDNFSGLQIHGQNMISGKGDGNDASISALAGTSFAGGAGHIVLNFTYEKQDGVPSSARGYSQEDSPVRSSYTPAGIFFDAAGDGYTFDPNNNVTPYVGTANQRFNRAADRLLTIPVERYIGSMLSHYDVSPSAQLYAEFTYSKTKANGQIEPLAVDDSGIQGESVYNFNGSAFPGISSSNPYMPSTIATAAGPGGFVDFRKRSNGLFDRSPYDDRDFFRGVIGIKGDLGSKWKYDLSYEHSQVRDDTTNGSILMNNYGASLQATTIGGQTVCADPAARAAGCVPINPFGNQTYTPAQLKWLSTYSGAGVIIPGATPGQAVVADFLQKNYQDVASLSLTGSLFNLPNGPLAVSVGAEYHHEKVTEIYDPFTISGDSSQQLNGDESGHSNSKDAFLELNAPLYGGHPWIYELSLEGAVRYDHYSYAGSVGNPGSDGVWAYKYGGTYAPSPDIRFRAIYARAVRAPNLNELYSPLANTAQQVTDPCDQAGGLGIDSTPPPALSPLPAGCAAIPGIANYLKTHQNFAYTLAQVQTIFGLVGGNPNLQSEATNTFTAGAAITPRFLRNFLLTADYYTIKVKNAIATVDPQTEVTGCFESGNPLYCNNIFRDANGFITEVDQHTINATSYRVAGLDIRAVYSFKSHIFAPNEKFNLDLYYNHKFAQEQTPFAGSVSDELGTADTYASQQLGTGFKDQFTFNLNFASGPVTINYRLKYLGPVTASQGTYDIPAYTYHDLQAKVRVGEARQLEFYVGCNNLLDKQPPFIAGGNSQWPGTNTVADTYDLIGRMLYAGFTAKF